MHHCTMSGAAFLIFCIQIVDVNYDDYLLVAGQFTIYDALTDGLSNH